MNEPTTDTAASVAISTTPQLQRVPMRVGERGIEIGNFDELWRFSTAVSKSGFAPKGIQTPEAIFIAIQMGLEVGLTPMAALQNIAVINGRPSIWGDAQLAVCRGTGDLESFEEYFVLGSKRLTLDDGKTNRNPNAKELGSDDCAAVCVVKRRGYAPASNLFSVADAKTAKLWGKEGPWSQYPGRMLRFRARGFILRDQFGDALKGILSAEDAQDMGPVIEVARPIFATPVPPNLDLIEAPKPAAGPTTESVQSDELPGLTPKLAINLPSNQSKTNPASKVRTIQDDLADAIKSAGVTFDQLQRWALELGHWEQELASIDEVPDHVARRLYGARTSMCKSILGGAQ